jgi:Ferritin-like domain
VIDRRRFLALVGGSGLAVAAASAPTASISSAAAALGAAVSDVQAGQTAASIENLLLYAYREAAALPSLRQFTKPVEATLGGFVIGTTFQHTEHARAFKDAVRTLGGRDQAAVDGAARAALVDPVLPGLKSATDVIRFLAGIELVAAETYAALIPQVDDRVLRSTLAGVTGVECQHRAVLLVMASLLDAGTPSLLTVPPKTASLPAAVGSAGFPDTFLPLDRARPPAEGAAG